MAHNWTIPERWGLCCPGVPRTHCVAQIGFELLAVLSYPCKCWDYSCELHIWLKPSHPLSHRYLNVFVLKAEAFSAGAFFANFLAWQGSLAFVWLTIPFGSWSYGTVLPGGHVFFPRCLENYYIVKTTLVLHLSSGSPVLFFFFFNLMF